jgi:hypothetical protein
MIRILSATLIWAIALLGCTEPTKRPPVAYGSCQMYFIADTGPDEETFRRTVQSALSGNHADMTTVFRWERFTDGEGSLNYSMLLSDLRSHVGQRIFENATETLLPEERDSIQRRLDTARRMKALLKKTASATPAEQNGCRQRLVWHLSCHRRFPLAVA